MPLSAMVLSSLKTAGEFRSSGMNIRSDTMDFFFRQYCHLQLVLAVVLRFYFQAPRKYDLMIC